MTPPPEWLLPLVLLEDCGGDWDKYIELLYSFFKDDFASNTIFYKAEKVILKRGPLVKGKEVTFWHLLEGGSLPGLRRCERIRWVRAIIENSDNPSIKVWENERKNEKRVCLWYEEEDYLVVLAKRKGYCILWTAYFIDKEHTKEKLRKEYEAYKKADAATKDGIVTPSTRGR